MGILIYHKWGDTTAGCFVSNNFCINALMAYKSYFSILQPLYNMVCYNTVLDIKQFKYVSQNV